MKKYLLALLVLSFLGCGNKNACVENIRMGMTEQQVIDVMGQPMSKRTTYLYPNFKQVTFDNGKVSTIWF